MGTNASAAAVRHDTAEDHRFAELAARTGLEPELRRRCADDPVAVLSEFGLPATEAPYGDASDAVAILAELGLCAAEPLYAGGSVLIEDLDRLDSLTAVQPACLGCTRPASLSLEVPGAVGA